MIKLKLVKICSDDDVSWHIEQGIINIVIGNGIIDKNNEFIARNSWRLSPPGDKDLLNIDIAKGSGKLLTVEVIAYSGSLNEIDKIGTQLPNKETGIPCVDLSSWNSSSPDFYSNSGPMFPTDRDSLINLWNGPEGPMLYNITEPFNLQLLDATLRIKLFSNTISRHIVAGEKVVFEFDNEDNLCAITLIGLDVKTLQHIKNEIGDFQRN